MMFLEFFIWGGWFVTMGSYLASAVHASGAQSALAYSTQSWGAIIAPLIVGLIADRYFNAERLLGALHLAGGVLMYALYSAHDFQAFYPYVLAYMILYMPTLALVNAISFRQMADPARHFSGCTRVGHDRLDRRRAGHQLPVRLGFAAPASPRGAAQHLPHVRLASLALGLYSFTLPRTPPAAASRAAAVIVARCWASMRWCCCATELPGVFPGLDPDLHSARVLLPERQSVSDRDSGRQRHRQADHRTDVGGALHAARSRCSSRPWA